MNFNEFRKSTLKLNDKRHHKIKNSIGVRDAYRWLQQNKWPGINQPVSEKEFYKIIRSVNTLITQEIIEGRDVKFPQRMGQLEVRKYTTYVKIDNGQIKTNRGIDWDKTLKLWYEDEEAKDNKILVKKEDFEQFTIFYNKSFANYNNKTLYQFKPNRALLLAVKQAGKEGKIDAYRIGK